MKAQEEAKPAETPAEQPIVTEPVVEETAPVETPPVETPPSVDKIIVDGEELTLEQIKEFRAGYSRTQDYTQKTQEIARIRRESQEAIELYEYLQKNPVIAETLLQAEQLSPDDKQRLARLDPRTAHTSKVERELNDLRLQREIDTLSSKYSDFDVVKVLQTAYEKQLPNLEDAYKLVRGERDLTAPVVESTPVTPVATPVDLEAERAKIRAELLAEMQAEQNATKTIISASSGTAPTPQKEVTLTPEQDRVRKLQGMSVDEYVKWMTK